MKHEMKYAVEPNYLVSSHLDSCLCAKPPDWCTVWGLINGQTFASVSCTLFPFTELQEKILARAWLGFHPYHEGTSSPSP